MVEPGALETWYSEQPSEASKLVRTRAQRIPSRSRASARSKTGYICADQTAFFTFRLQQGGGPYIPDRRRYIRNSESLATVGSETRFVLLSLSRELLLVCPL
jgi:hypothetical protein